MEKEIEKIVNKKIRKNTIIILIVAIVLGSFTGVGAYQMSAKEINFTPSNNKWKVNNVSDAIDDLLFKKVSNNYSTEETVVGEWIDGKPLYQKVIMTSEFVTINKNWFTISNVSSLNIDKLVDATILGTQNTSSIINAAVQVVNGNLQVYTDDYDMSGDGVIIKYTKTTDEASN